MVSISSQNLGYLDFFQAKFIRYFGKIVKKIVSYINFGFFSRVIQEICVKNLDYFLGSLKTSCVIPAKEHIHSWIENQMPGERGVNIIMGDFVGMSEADFCKVVIRLNIKLITSNHSSFYELKLKE